MSSSKTFVRVLFSVSFFVTFFLLAASFNIQKAEAAEKLTGYGWSDNIGWISFASSDCDTDGSGTMSQMETDANPGCPPSGSVVGQYSVVHNTTALTGFAWSDNIGWIQFGNLSSFPSGNGTRSGNARLNADGTLDGWVRACGGTISAPNDCSNMQSRGDGWDGWISLKGTASNGASYGAKVNSPASDSFAWGSDVVGWVSFRQVRFGGDLAPFNYSLVPDQGTLYIRRGRTATSVISRDLLSGTTQFVSISSITGLPPGLTVVNVDNNRSAPTYSCSGNSDSNQSCKSKIIFRADSTQALLDNSPYAVTITGTTDLGLVRTVIISIEISDPSSVSCTADKQFARRNEPVTWTAEYRGAVTADPTTWAGDEISTPQTGNPLQMRYQLAGLKTMTADVSGRGQATCTITITNQPRYIEK